MIIWLTKFWWPCPGWGTSWASSTVSCLTQRRFLKFFRGLTYWASSTFICLQMRFYWRGSWFFLISGRFGFFSLWKRYWIVWISWLPAGVSDWTEHWAGFRQLSLVSLRFERKLLSVQLFRVRACMNESTSVYGGGEHQRFCRFLYLACGILYCSITLPCWLFA